MVGDRYLTDVVFGNRNGMLTIRPAPFTPKGEPKAVLLVRLGGGPGGGWGAGAGCCSLGAGLVEGCGAAVRGLLAGPCSCVQARHAKECAPAKPAVSSTALPAWRRRGR